MPTGRITRRFVTSSRLEEVRRWVESELAEPSPGFELVSTHPRFVASVDNQQRTLQEADLHSGASFFLRSSE